MTEHDPALVEKAAEAIYPLVMETWEDRWPIWEYADEGQADFMREVARAVLDAVAPAIGEQARQEGAREALRAAADALEWVRPEHCPCDAPDGCCGSESACDAMRPVIKVVDARWLRERAERAATPGSGTAGGGT